MKPEREGGLPRFCISQPFVGEDAPTEAEIEESLKKYDFVAISDGAYYNINRNILLTDAFRRNVKIWKGYPIPFDAIASNPDLEVKKWILDRLL